MVAAVMMVVMVVGSSAMVWCWCAAHGALPVTSRNVCDHDPTEVPHYQPATRPSPSSLALSAGRLSGTTTLGRGLH